MYDGDLFFNSFIAYFINDISYDAVKPKTNVRMCVKEENMKAVLKKRKKY